MNHKFTAEQLATIVAALRLYQDQLVTGMDPDNLTWFEECESLSVDEIDEFIYNISIDEVSPFMHPEFQVQSIRLSDQRSILVELLENTLFKRALEKSHLWPGEWDGFEIRWLVSEIMKDHIPDGDKRHRARYRKFINYAITHGIL